MGKTIQVVVLRPLSLLLVSLNATKRKWSDWSNSEYYC